MKKVLHYSSPGLFVEVAFGVIVVDPFRVMAVVPFGFIVVPFGVIVVD